MQAKSKIYLDHNATTGLCPEVRAAVSVFLEEFGNPSSIHWASRAPKMVIREARKKASQLFNCRPPELIFTSGASESSNTVIKGLFDLLFHPDWVAQLGGRNEFITTEVEHPSVLKTFEWLQTRGAKVHYLKVSREGEINLQQYAEFLSEKTALVSIMFANNETGVRFPIKMLAEKAHAQGAFFHTDAVQALGKVAFDLQDLNVDYASFSAHKFYALKGTGLLYVKRGSPYESLIHGGAQERSRRGGTENTLGIFALGEALNRLTDLPLRAPQIEKLRDDFEARLMAEIPGVHVTSPRASRLPNTSSLILDDVDGETLLMSLDLKGFAVSTGAACSSGSPEPSPVLLAIGLSREEAQSSLRVSLGWETTESDMNEFFVALKSVVERIRSLSTSGGNHEIRKV